MFVGLHGNLRELLLQPDYQATLLELTAALDAPLRAQWLDVLLNLPLLTSHPSLAMVVDELQSSTANLLQADWAAIKVLILPTNGLSALRS